MNIEDFLPTTIHNDDTNLKKKNEEENEESETVHIRIQQRNRKKCILTISGLPKNLDLKKICKYFKKNLQCSGAIKQDEDWGAIIQLQGDHREAVKKYLIDEKIVPKESIKIHGF
jgi:translation initiation factor 1